MITRRALLEGVTAIGLSGLSLGAYAFGIEPRFRLEVTRYRLLPPGWSPGLHLRLAVVADLHATEPYMPPERIAEIVERTNSLGADAILLLGDYVSTLRFQTRQVPPREWAGLLGGFKAPLGVHAVLGNHDWWDDRVAQKRRAGPVQSRIELERAGIRVYENDVLRLDKGGRPFWLAGLGDQLAFPLGRRRGWPVFRGADDLPGTLAKVTDHAPVILMAHEPDIFPSVPARVALTVSGHTHGGQVRLFGYSPHVPSIYGNRYAYGHVVEKGRNLVVSGGLGCSGLPVRLGVPPEVVLVEVGDASPSVWRSGISHA
jgi:predicted MPP superfamily phosphohydrolase